MGHGPSAHFQVLNASDSVMADLPLLCLTSLECLVCPLHDAGVGVAVLIPRAAWMDLLEDSCQVSFCRDITFEDKGGPGGGFHPSHICTHMGTVTF